MSAALLVCVCGARVANPSHGNHLRSATHRQWDRTDREKYYLAREREERARWEADADRREALEQADRDREFARRLAEEQAQEKARAALRAAREEKARADQIREHHELLALFDAAARDASPVAKQLGTVRFEKWLAFGDKGEKSIAGYAAHPNPREHIDGFETLAKSLALSVDTARYDREYRDLWDAACVLWTLCRDAVLVMQDRAREIGTLPLVQPGTEIAQ